MTDVVHNRHKSIIAYLLANNRTNTTTILRSELGLGEDVFDAEVAKKYEPLLEKKWATVDRLEKKVYSYHNSINVVDN